MTNLAYNLDQYPDNGRLVIVKIETWLTTTEAAEIMGIDRDTVANYCRLGKLECRKRGRDWQVSREAAERFVKSNVGRPKIDKT